MSIKTIAPLDPITLAALRAFQYGRPIAPFAQLLGLSFKATVRALEGQGIQVATRHFIATRLKELTAGNVAPVEGAAA